MLQSSLNFNIMNHVEDEFNTVFMNCDPAVWAEMFDDDTEENVEYRDKILKYTRSTLFQHYRHAYNGHIPRERSDRLIKKLFANPKLVPRLQRLKMSVVAVMALVIALLMVPLYWHHTYLNTDIFHPQTLDIMDILQQEFDARNPSDPIYQYAANYKLDKGSSVLRTSFEIPEPELGPEYTHGIYVYRTLDDRLTRYDVASNAQQSNCPLNETEVIMLARERDAIRDAEASQSAQRPFDNLSTRPYYLEDDFQMLAMASANAANGVTARVKAASQAASTAIQADLAALDDYEDLDESTTATTAEVIAAAAKNSPLPPEEDEPTVQVDNQELLNLIYNGKATQAS